MTDSLTGFLYILIDQVMTDMTLLAGGRAAMSAFFP
jgi:hypothetical protein